MAASAHPDYPLEHAHLQQILAKVERVLTDTSLHKSTLDESLADLARHYDPDNQQNYIDMLTWTLLQDRADRQLVNLAEARGTPYFARIDFAETGKALERLYIGKLSLIDEETQRIDIVDWRAPVSNLYYEGRLGPASYQCPSGLVEGSLSLKRQFSIKEGQLQTITDVDITTDDELLSAFSSASTDDRLKEIVSTIQTEQNRIIRADMWKPLVVQGAAGSGKTTIALHRIAYLAYNHPELKPDAFMVIAPNAFFLNYISDVLPDLGVENIYQTTFEGYAMRILGKKLKVRDPHEKLAALAAREAGREEENRLMMRVAAFKSSMAFRRIIDRYITYVEEEFLPREDLTVGGMTIFTYAQIEQLFRREYSNLPIAKRVEQIQKHMVNRLGRVRAGAIEQLNLNCDREVMQLKLTVPEEDPTRQQRIIALIEAKNERVALIEKHAKTAVSEYIKRINRVSPMDYYRNLVADPVLLLTLAGEEAEEEFLLHLSETTAATLQSGWYETEDLAPMIYLKYRIHGIDERSPVRQIVIDEAQDLSVFQLFVLHKIIYNSSFTILGDLCQGLQSYKGILSWQDVVDQVFEGDCEFLTLEKSYRSTIEIIGAANAVLATLHDDQLIPGSPILRHGPPVSVVAAAGLKQVAEDMVARIRAARQRGLRSTAIVCKTLQECKLVAAQLKRLQEPAYLITGKEHVYQGGTHILPVHLVKGLEFDTVLLADVSAEKYTATPLDVKLLYVAMTRPLHELTLYHVGEPSPLLRQLPGA